MPQPKRSANRWRASRKRGFTLVELLITIVLAAIVMAAAFMLTRAISSVFYTQDQTVDTQGNLRFALEFIDRDVRRAGLLGTPSAGADPLICPKPTVSIGANNLAAIRVRDNIGAGDVYDNGVNVFIAPDELFLMGSFDSSVIIPVSNVRPGSPMQLDPRVVGEVFGTDEGGFESLFTPGRLLHIYDKTGVGQLVPIESRAWNGGSPTVVVGGLQQRSGGRGCGIEGIAGEGYDVSVVSIIRYSVVPDPAAPEKMDLIRTEMNAATGNPLQIGTNDLSVPVLEYVVDFQVWLDGNTANFGAPSVTADTVQGDNAGNLSLAALSATSTWQRARVAHISIAARTHREDRTQPHRPRASANAPLLTFDTNSDPAGSARVITLRSTIELTNVTIRNVY